MRMDQGRGRAFVLGVAAMLGVWGLRAEAITYNVTIVQFEFGAELFDGQNNVGAISGLVFSSNLPIGLTTSSASYAGSVGQGFGINGAWALSDGQGNELSGNFENLNRFTGQVGGPLIRGTGTTTINGGLGTFAQASGGGTFEVFARDFFGPSGPEYQQVVVNRMQITLPDGPEQTDLRNVVVSVRVGANDLPNEAGQNVGGPTSDDAPAGFPRLTQLRSEYEYGAPFPNQGQSFSRNAAGDGQDWTFEFGPGSQLTDYFFLSQGTADVVSGQGFYEGYTGQSDWIAFESWMFQISPDISTYSNVVIDRYSLQAPVPEPEIYAMMLAGLAAIGFAARRRRSPR